MITLWVIAVWVFVAGSISLVSSDSPYGLCTATYLLSSALATVSLPTTSSSSSLFFVLRQLLLAEARSVAFSRVRPAAWAPPG